LSRFERHRRFTTALRARGHRFGLGEPAATAWRTLALYFARFATLGLVFEVFVMEEVLFSRCEDEIC